jgi:hypothetical protein
VVGERRVVLVAGPRQRAVEVVDPALETELLGTT